MAQVTAYVSRLESLVNTAVEPKELLGLDMRPLLFGEVEVYRDEPFRSSEDGSEIIGHDGKAIQHRVKIADHKFPRETRIRFGAHGGRGIGMMPVGRPIVTITYEGMLTVDYEGLVNTPGKSE